MNDIEEAQAMKRQMATVAALDPAELNRLARVIYLALRGQPRVLMLSAMADVLSHAMVSLSPEKRRVTMAAFATMTLEMTALRDTAGQTRQ
jgi:hypothetical protein